MSYAYGTSGISPFSHRELSNVDFLDAIRDGDWSNTILQFTYEPADCGMLFIKEIILDITAIWKEFVDYA